MRTYGGSHALPGAADHDDVAAELGELASQRRDVSFGSGKRIGADDLRHAHGYLPLRMIRAVRAGPVT